MLGNWLGRSSKGGFCWKKLLGDKKSRESWLKAGDKNTGFFHKMANAHRRRNSLVRIKINRHWAPEESEIKDSVVQAFQSLVFENGDWHPNCLGLDFDVSSIDEAALLEASFSKEEVFKALLDLSEDKAPSSDGFSLVFWMFNWDFVKNKGDVFLYGLS